MFGKRLNYIRKKRGVTALEMSEYLSMGLRAYRNYESEDRFPPFPVLIRIADKLDVSIDWLLGRDEWLHSHGVFVDEY
ncbi:helix-turn-helix transcriptional regulator [Emergencia sp. JLR.KK010]|uniref:helix-turn-helix domain-containing protein n=1 Tax=Emergencia sp. JLR.KK010 TaxID=3114296 RepID=UPI0030D26CF4